jgi:hypothetical protein
MGTLGRRLKERDAQAIAQADSQEHGHKDEDLSMFRNQVFSQKPGF